MDIKARNNLHIPVRLTLTNSGDTILITVGESGAALKDFYLICIDTDLLPNKAWEDVGSLEIRSKYNLSICGKKGIGE